MSKLTKVNTMDENSTHSVSAEEEQTVEMIWDVVKTGGTLKDIHSLSDDTMDGLYAYAYDFYNKGQLDDAETFFKFLCTYDFYNPDYFLGLAAVYQLKKQYQKACDLYSVVFAMTKNDYRPVFFSGQCQLLMGNKPRACQCFSLVVSRSEDKTLVIKAEAYLSMFNDLNDPVDNTDNEQT